jgi:putative endonuclease
MFGGEAEESAPRRPLGVIDSRPMKRRGCSIISNKPRCLYTGFTDDLIRRVFEHKEKLFPESFTARYVFDMLVFYEEYSQVVSARMREKEIKGWRREKKLQN